MGRGEKSWFFLHLQKKRGEMIEGGRGNISVGEI